MRKIFFAIAAALLSTTLASAQFTTVAMRKYALTDFNFKRAAALADDNKYYDATLELQKSVGNNPKAPEPYFALGAIYAGYSDTKQEAIDNLSKAIALSEKSNPSLCVQALYLRSRAYADASNPLASRADAQEAYNMAKKLSPNDENKDYGSFALGYYYAVTCGEPLEAATYFREAVNTAPFSNSNRSYHIRTLLTIGTSDALAEAQKVLNDGLTLNGADDNMRLLSSSVDIAKEDYSSAAETIVSLFTDEGIFTEDKTLWRNWNDVLENNPTSIIMQIKGRMAANPMVSTWPELLGMTYVEMTSPNYALAADCFHKAYDISGNPTDLSFEASALESAGDLTGALEVLDKYIAQDTTFAGIYVRRASINAQLDRKQTVLTDYAKAISLRGDANDYYLRAWFERYNGMPQEAALDMTTAIQKESDNAHYYLTRGSIFASIGETDMAREDYEAARDISRKAIADAGEDNLNTPYDTAYVAEQHQQLAYALFYLGDADGALSEMNKGIQTTAEYVSGARYNKACLLSLMGKKQEAIGALGQAIDTGFDDYVHLGRDFDLDNIRQMKEFKALVAKAKENATGKNSTKATTAKADDNGEPTVVEVPFAKEGGVLTVPCTVNGLPLKYIFDSGAADVTISLVEARFMLRNGYLKATDLGNRSIGSGADGGLIAGTKVLLRSITFGGVTLKDVRATVIETQSAPLLLGQTAMSRYGTATIDYGKGVIRLARNVK